MGENAIFHNETLANATASDESIQEHAEILSIGSYDLSHRIDNWFDWIYLFEFIIKILGLGIMEYFRDTWNRFDFFLLVLSFSSTSAFSLILRNARAAKSTKLIKLIRLQKAIKGVKCLKSVRSLRFSKWCIANWESINRVKNLLYKILLSIPSSNLQIFLFI